MCYILYVLQPNYTVSILSHSVAKASEHILRIYSEYQ